MANRVGIKVVVLADIRSGEDLNIKKNTLSGFFGESREKRLYNLKLNGQGHPKIKTDAY